MKSVTGDSGRPAWTSWSTGMDANHNGLYVSAEVLVGDNHTGMLRARSSTASDWELFYLYRYSDGTYAFRSCESAKYVAVELTTPMPTTGC